MLCKDSRSAWRGDEMHGYNLVMTVAVFGKSSGFDYLAGYLNMIKSRLCYFRLDYKKKKKKSLAG